jgi:hypothetical protein
MIGWDRRARSVRASVEPPDHVAGLVDVHRAVAERLHLVAHEPRQWAFFTG